MEEPVGSTVGVVLAGTSSARAQQLRLQPKPRERNQFLDLSEADGQTQSEGGVGFSEALQQFKLQRVLKAVFEAGGATQWYTYLVSMWEAWAPSPAPQRTPKLSQKKTAVRLNG